MDVNTRNIPSRKSFRVKMKKSLKSLVTPYFYFGSRKVNIILSQMRLGFCDLLFYLHNKGCVESPTCVCGNGNENFYHFFFVCGRFIVQRQEFQNAFADILLNNNCDLIPSVDLLLNGSTAVNEHINTLIHSAVTKYIADTNRFN